MFHCGPVEVTRVFFFSFFLLRDHMGVTGDGSKLGKAGFAWINDSDTTGPGAR